MLLFDVQGRQQEPSSVEALSQLQAMFPQTSQSVLESTLRNTFSLEGAIEHLLSSSGKHSNFYFWQLEVIFFHRCKTLNIVDCHSC